MSLDLRALARVEMPELPPLPHLYEAARATWQGRMVNEYSSASVFEGLAAQLAAAALHDEARTCVAFAAEERRHGVLCGAVVEALGGEARADVPARAPFPKHADAQPIEAALRSVLSVSCLSETVAVALIGAERIEMPASALRDLLTSIWSDEIGHARFGWALVASRAASLDEATRASLGRYLAVAFAHLEAHELAHLPVSTDPPAEGVALGLCSGASARELFFDTVREVIVPRLEAMGLPASRAWAERGRRSAATPCTR